MKTLSNQYKLIKENKGHKGVFLKEAKRQFPNLIKNNSTFKEASTILKQKGIISENFVGTPMIGNPISTKKESYETAFSNFIAEAEAKAEEKKVSKEVEEDYSKNYDQRDDKNPDNMIFGQIQMGYYYEMKQEKNADKTIEEIKDIVFKNLAKDPIYYTKTGQFGEDIGYEDDAPGLGEPKEPKGKYKSSGYGNLKENKILKEEKYSGAIIRKGSSDRAKKDTKIVRQALKDKGIKFTNRGEFGMDFKDADLAQIRKVISGLKVGEFIVSHDEDKSKKPINEVIFGGGIVSGGGFTSTDYRKFYGLDEAEGDADDAKATADEMERAAAAAKEIGDTELFEDGAPMHIEKLVDAAEAAYNAGMDIDEILSMIEQHLGLKMGDY